MASNGIIKPIKMKNLRFEDLPKALEYAIEKLNAIEHELKEVR